MSSVDNRIVNMQFNSAQFERGVATTLKSLEKLKQGLNLSQSTRDLQTFEKTANNFSLGGIENTLQSVGKRFSTLGIVGMTAIQNITNKAMSLGHKLVSAVWDPIAEGGARRAANLEQAKFQIDGLGKKWEDVEEDINYGVQDTAYGLDAAAKVASQLLASSVEIGEPMKKALRGISGVAAMTNSSYEDIGQVFTAVAGNGRLMASELRRLSLRGINAAATLAKGLGKTEKEIREMTRKGEIDFATFAEAMDNAFGEHAKDANKTFDGALSNMKAAMARLGEPVSTALRQNKRDIFNSITPIFNVLKDGLKDYAGTYSIIETVISNVSKKLVKTFKKFGYTTDKNGKRIYKKNALLLHELIGNLTSAFKNIGTFALDILKAIGKAFRDVFPKKSMTDITKFTKHFWELTRRLKLGKETADKLRRTFRGIFSIFGIIVDLAKEAIKVFSSLWKSTKDVRTGFLDISAGIGDWLVNLRKAIKEQIVLTKIFEFFSNIAKSVMALFKRIGQGISNIYNGVKKFFSGSKGKVLQNFINMLKNLLGILKEISKSILDSIINTSVKEAGGILNKLMAGGVLAAFISFKKAVNSNKFSILDNVTKPFKDLAGNIGSISKSLGSLLDSLGNTLRSFSKKVESEALINIAKGLAILVGSLFVLSLVETEDLYSAMTAMTIFMAAFTKVFSGLTKFKKGLDLASAGIYIRAIGVSMLMLTASIAILAQIPLKKLENGIMGITALLGILTAVIRLTSSKEAMFIARGASAIIAMGISVRILAAAVEALSKIPVDKLLNATQAIIGLMVVLTTFVVASSDSKRMIAIGFGLIEMAAAVVILTSAIRLLTDIPYNDLEKSLTAVIGIIVALTAFVSFVSDSKRLPAIGFGLILTSAALEIMADVMHRIVDISWEGLTKVGITLTAFIFSVIAMLSAFEKFEDYADRVKSFKKLAIGLILINVSLEILADVVGKLAAVPWEDLPKAGVAIGMFGYGIIKLFDALKEHKPSQLLKLSGTFLIVSLAIKAFAKAVVRVSEVNWGGIAKIVVVIGMLLAAVTGFSEVNMRGFSGVTAGIFLLAIAVRMLSKISVLNAVLAIGTLIGTFYAISKGVKILSPVIDKVWAVSKALLFFSLSMSALSVSAMLFGVSLMLIGGGFAAIGAAGYTIVDVLGGFAEALKKHGPSLVEGIFGIVKQVLVSITTLIPEFANLVITIIREALRAFNEMVPEITKSIGIFVESIIPILTKYIPDIVNAAFEFLSKVLDVLIQKVPEIIPKVLTLLSVVFKSLQDALNGVDPETFAVGVLAFGILIGMFVMLAAASKYVKDSIKTIIAMGIAYGLMTAMFLILNTIDANSILIMAGSLSGALLAITACMAIASMIPVGAALQGIVGLAAVIGGLTLIIAALGALKQIPGLQWFIDEGADMLKSIGSAIGGFFGSIIGGFMEGVTSGLVGMADNLSEFMLHLTPFIMGAKLLDADTMAGVKALAETILILTAAELIDGLAGWLTGGSSITKFGDDMVALAPCLAEFADKVKGLNTKDIKKAAMAGKVLAEFANALPKSGGLAQWFGGETISMEAFGEQMKAFAPALNDFAAQVKGIETGDVKKAVRAGKMLAGLANALPDYNGVAQWFGGNKMTLSQFANELEPYGKAITAYSEAVSGKIKSKDIEASANAGKMLSSLANGLDDYGGVAQFFGGEKQKLSEFAAELGPFGEAIAAYSEAVDGKVSETAVKASANAGQALADLQSSLESHGGFSSIFEGEKSLASFGEDLKLFGKAFAEYYNEIKDISNPSILNSVLYCSTKMLEILKTISTFEGDFAKNGTEFKEGISAIASANITGFVETFQNFTDEDISGIQDVGKKIMQNIATGCLKYSEELSGKANDAAVAFIGYLTSGLDAERDNYTASLTWYDQSNKAFIKNSTKSFKKIGTSLISKWIKGLNAKQEKFKQALNKYADIMSKFRNEKTGLFKKFGSKAVDNMVSGFIDTSRHDSFASALRWYSTKISTFKQKYFSNWKNIGINAVKGLTSGITEESEADKNPVSEMKKIASGMLKAVRRKLKINSPSKELFSDGKNSVRGFAGGIDRYAYLVTNSAGDIADSMVATLKTPLSILADYLAGDLDFDPVIRPVMDLSEIQNGSGYINGLFSNPNMTLSGLGINAANISGNIGLTDDSMLYDDTNVISAIADLRSEVSDLSSTIQSLQIVLDTGATVGALTPKIDRSLGSIASLKERGI